MPCAQSCWLAALSAVAQLLSFGAPCRGGPPPPGPLRFPDRRQEHFINALPEYHVVAPVQVDASGHFLSYGLHLPVKSSRKKRDLDGSEDHVYYRISHEEKDLFFNMTVNQGFLSNSYIVEKRYGNLSHVQMTASSAPRCHLRGTVLQQGTSVGTAALSACHGLVSAGSAISLPPLHRPPESQPGETGENQQVPRCIDTWELSPCDVVLLSSKGVGEKMYSK
uniref:Peptidase M12B propeptide domain-containing protein n=1 Tax=Microcebus murinus TaxID=30608 RepID=A0A8C5Y8F4_MICMU